jgi:hypothetical protein
MRDFQSVWRALVRRTGIYEDKSSWPLISGDTYRSLCQIKIDSINDFPKIQEVVGFSGKVFVSAGVASQFFEELENVQDSSFKNVDLIIHNGDLIPDYLVFAKWNFKFSSISSVNWLHELQNVYPLPIGLENWDYMRNGVPSDFKLPGQAVRDIDLLVCFSDHTNPVERKAARDATTAVSGVCLASSTLSPRKYRELIKRSKFVLSPPGNGPDCHRTWEALYLGATPIVKSEYWAFHERQLPVVVLESWENLNEALSISTNLPSFKPLDLHTMFLGDFNAEV